MPMLEPAPLKMPKELWVEKQEIMPWVWGAATMPSVLAPPPLWPNTITFSGSPPKAAMFSCTHSMDLMQSIRP